MFFPSGEGVISYEGSIEGMTMAGTTDSPERGEGTFKGRIRRWPTRASSLYRFDSEQRPVFVVRQHVEQTIGTLAHMTDSLAEFGEEPFAT